MKAKEAFRDFLALLILLGLTLLFLKIGSWF